MMRHLAAVLLLCAMAVLVVYLGAALYGMATVRAGVAVCCDGESFPVWQTGAGLLDEAGERVELGEGCEVEWR